MKEWYKEDLAYIHDVGHSDYALKSAPGILKILAQNNIRDGLVVDLGCGSGLSALELTKAHYQVFGVDISESLISIARNRVPSAEFRVESLFKVDIPSCNAVISVGECLNYLFDDDNNYQILTQLLERIYNALAPGGVFVFDIAEPGQVIEGNRVKSFTEGKDWIVLVEKEEDQEKLVLSRRIVTLRRVGEYYRRDDELHYLGLYKAADITEKLSQVGFTVESMESYGDYKLPQAHVAFVAHKSM
ncbi:class I SAM-dependent methyltransferase [Phormidesmis priestleyi ULC007]|uniref:Class I SAM-dependent methyltransferase n=1 Tax=Phormidesmis priestleyi ULC007 TaxID=1920490 RepID=A0A2T1D3U6_9CYAN|nr:class I SAM-dependent methyltransferase [Phormidesmis priestleyi]PSB15149.1 class I SAM-dependent methyltransferase [Phormidesmis priestleyi ULC007]